MNRKEFENLIPGLRPKMVRIGLIFLGNIDDAEDVAQDALMRLWNSCEQLSSNRNIETLAVMVTKSVCVEKYRMMQKSNSEQVEENLISDSYSADSAVIAAETRQEIFSAIRQLSPREQQLVRKRYLEDRSAEEISKEMRIAKPSLKSMLSTAKSKLKKILRK